MINILLTLSLTLPSLHAALTRGDNRPDAYAHHGTVVSTKPLRFDDGHVTYTLAPKVSEDSRNHPALIAAREQKVDLWFGDDDVESVERTNLGGAR